MPAIYPVATRRVSELLVQQRLLSQFEYDRSELLRLQDQLSTGYRISVPSQDAPAALRAAAIQRLLEQKTQARVNLSTTQSYVAATDSALQGVSDLLADIRAQAITAVDSTTSDDEREAIAEEVGRTLEQLVEIGNRQFRGRSLFAGSTTTIQPFEMNADCVVYHGNENALRSYVDVGLLTDTNLTGDQVFGAISPERLGRVDLNPILATQTRLADLRGGQGVNKGGFIISDGNSARTVDLSLAETIGDVMRLIEDHAPDGRQLTVRVTATGLTVDIDDAGGGNLTIREMAGGTTAAELGILKTQGSGVSPIVGSDLDPRLLPTTQLRQILGTRAQAILESAGAKNNILLDAVDNGAAANNVHVRFVSLLAVGNQALVNYDPVAQTLDIDVSPGATTANTVVAAISASGVFTAQLDDKQDPANDGSGLVDLTATATTAGGSGVNFDQESGLQIFNKGQTYTITFEAATTVEDVLNLINGSGADVLAGINADGNGLDVRSRASGTDFAIGENGGDTATQLGLRTLTADTPLSDLNYGRGVAAVDGTDFVIRRKDGVTLAIDVSSAFTIGDVLDLINLHPDNTGNVVAARLAEYGNGIEIYDTNNAGAESLTVTRSKGFAVWDLGLIPRGEDQAIAIAASGGTPELLRGEDVSCLETKSAFNSLLRLLDGLEDFSLPDIERAVTMLDEDYRRLNFARSELGARGRALDMLQQRIEVEDVQLRKTLSDEIDTDFVEAVSQLSARQANLEATLRLSGRLFQLSLLNYL